ncbi:unnamed protein product [Rodentolepis nana]|uniref:Tetratricopeptide repeat (TPR)-like superfamily protein n=1 Tax=Rodentolepis nana TaxID=102285 RepID=A0A0R3T470_RODNA|nr:unnamed protein product [Rodentolepis nana]
MERQICDYHPATMAEMVMMQQYMNNHPNHWTSQMPHETNTGIYHGFPLDSCGDYASPIFKGPNYSNSLYAPPETMLGFSSDHYSLKPTDDKDNLLSKSLPSKMLLLADCYYRAAERERAIEFTDILSLPPSLSRDALRKDLYYSPLTTHLTTDIIYYGNLELDIGYIQLGRSVAIQHREFGEQLSQSSSGGGNLDHQSKTDVAGTEELGGSADSKVVNAERRRLSSPNSDSINNRQEPYLNPNDPNHNTNGTSNQNMKPTQVALGVHMQLETITYEMDVIGAEGIEKESNEGGYLFARGGQTNSSCLVMPKMIS